MRENPIAVYGDIPPLLREGALNIVNVECVLGDAGEPILKAGPNLRGEPATARSLIEAGFHVATLANNHTLDFGPEGLRQTLEVLKQAGLKTVGAGMSGQEAARPLIVDMKGRRVGILNCSEGEACCSWEGRPGAHGFDVPALIEQIHELKSAADIVLVIFHGGREHAPMPPMYVVKGLRALAQAGAHAVVAHHPHVPQGMENHHGVPIFYSLGNFLFYRKAPAFFQNTGYLVHLDFSGSRLAGWAITPYRLTDRGIFQLKGEAKASVLGDLKRVSDLLGDPKAIADAFCAFVDQFDAKAIFEMFETLITLSKENPMLAAARLHNLFFCPAHEQLFLNGLKRISRGELGNSPHWARDLVADWGHRPPVAD